MYRNYLTDKDPEFTGESVEVDLSSIVNSLAGPKRPQDRVPVSDMPSDFKNTLTNKIGFKGFGLKPENTDKNVTFDHDGKDYNLKHGSVVIALQQHGVPDIIIAAWMRELRQFSFIFAKQFSKWCLPPRVHRRQVRHC